MVVVGEKTAGHNMDRKCKSLHEKAEYKNQKTASQ